MAIKIYTDCELEIVHNVFRTINVEYTLSQNLIDGSNLLMCNVNLSKLPVIDWHKIMGNYVVIYAFETTTNTRIIEELCNRAIATYKIIHHLI